MFEILKLLALKREIYQSEMAEMVGTSYRNLIRQLQLLGKVGLIRIVRKEPSQKRGRERHVWALTFRGLLSYLTAKGPKLRTDMEIDQIAEANKDKWLIFQEWEDLTRDLKVKEQLLSNICEVIFDDTVQSSITEVDEDSELLEVEAEIYGGSEVGRWLRDWYGDYLERHTTMAALGLALILEEAAVVPWIMEKKNENILWETALKNKNVRERIEIEFMLENDRHKKIKIFRDWLLKGKIPKCLPKEFVSDEQEARKFLRDLLTRKIKSGKLLWVQYPSKEKAKQA
jgi:predicted transcriptional regulator